MRRRRRFRLRHPAPFWIAAAALTALTMSVVSRVTASAAAERERWGEHVLVAVALDDVAPGEEIDAELRPVPAALVPGGGLRELPDGPAAAWIGAGEVVLAARVAPAGLSAVAALLPSGTRGVAIPIGLAPLPVEIGDRVDVHGSALLASNALVVAVGEEAITVAVDRDDADDVAYEAATGTVTLVLSGRR
jgi:Flp pilus assembly protein CpaB